MNANKLVLFLSKNIKNNKHVFVNRLLLKIIKKKPLGFPYNKIQPQFEFNDTIYLCLEHEHPLYRTKLIVNKIHFDSINKVYYYQLRDFDGHVFENFVEEFTLMLYNETQFTVSNTSFRSLMNDLKSKQHGVSEDA